MAPTRFDLTALVERLRASQFRVETRQFLAAAELLVAYAEAGVDVAGDRERLGRCLGPIFCSSPEEQAAFAEILDPPPSPPRQPPLDPPADPPFRAWHRARWAVPLGVAIVGVVALTVFYPTGPLPPDADRTAGKRQASGGLSGQPDAHPPSPGELQVPPTDQAPAPTSTGYRMGLVATLEPPPPTVMSRRQIGWARSLEEALACAAAAFVLWWLVARARGKLIL